MYSKHLYLYYLPISDLKITKQGRSRSFPENRFIFDTYKPSKKLEMYGDEKPHFYGVNGT